MSHVKLAKAVRGGLKNQDWQISEVPALIGEEIAETGAVQ
jgi:hypothetical protein